MRKNQDKPTALIIGGGIGGLAAAIALRQVSIAVQVFERAPDVREVGAGLSLWPNGLKVLDDLGLGAAVRARGVRDRQSALRANTGKTVVTTSGAELERLLGDTSLVIHRATLLSLLRRQLPEGTIVTGAACTDFVESGDSVMALFSDGTLRRGDLLIGADGIHSAIRERLFGTQPPTYAGYTAWRGVVTFDHGRLLPGVSIGKGCQFGQVPMGDRRPWPPRPRHPSPSSS